MNQTLIVPGQLEKKLRKATENALLSGALKKVDCELEHFKEEGVRFQIRMLANIGGKQKALKRFEEAGQNTHNPFLPYEQDLYVGDISENRLVLLNKFNVVDHHALIVSKEFEHQESPLSKEDFLVLSVAMSEIPSLGFYNGGRSAGASQMHRHLQLVPLAGMGGNIPLSPRVLNNTRTPFLYKSISQLSAKPSERCNQLYGFYLRTIDELNLKGLEGRLHPYNLLVCHDWAMIIPRTTESVFGIPINSLGFAGALLAKNPEQRLLIKEKGCFELLRQVAVNPVADDQIAQLEKDS